MQATDRKTDHIDPKQLLGPPITEEYEPDFRQFAFNLFFNPHRPYFTRWYIGPMLTDPRITFGLLLLGGPILSSSRFYIDTSNPLLKEYLSKQLNRLWINAAPIALRSMEYGYQGAEIIYRPREGKLSFDCLKYLHPSDTRPVILRGRLVGIQVTGVESRKTKGPLYMGIPKAFWAVHSKHTHPWFGNSRLRGAFYPWYEYWSVRGYRDMRRQWFHRNAFTGPIISYPRGSSPPVNRNGTIQAPVDNREMALKMVDRFISGSGLAVPSEVGWEVQVPQAMSVPEGLLEYGDSLRDEEWEGMGIPPEVARAEGTGAFGGRRVPQQAFYAILQEIVQGLLSDFDDQILRPLVNINFSPREDYEIQTFGLLRESGEEQQGQVEESQEEPLLASDRVASKSFSGFVLEEKPHEGRVAYRASTT